MPEKQSYQYRRGRKARVDGKKINECPYGELYSKTQWLASWNDKDMELRGAK